MTVSHMQHETTQTCAAGMDRFFSPVNLIRYRKLAAGAIDDSERFRLLRLLAEEMKTFKREARAAALKPAATSIFQSFDRPRASSAAVEEA